MVEEPAEHEAIAEMLRSMGNSPEVFIDWWARSGTFTVAQLNEVRDLGIRDGYISVRNSGVSHADALAAWRAGITGRELVAYAGARRDGASHEQVVIANERGIRPSFYSNAVTAGVPDDELFAALDAGVDLGRYIEARIYGAPHNDVMSAWTEGLNLSAYAAGREGAAGHLEAHEFARKHQDDWP